MIRQVKIRGGYHFRRGFSCRGEDMDELYFDHILSKKNESYSLNETDVERIIIFLKRWQKRKSDKRQLFSDSIASLHKIERNLARIEA